MNTTKQVNAMIGLLMVGLIGTFLYFLFDNGFDFAGIHFKGREEVAAQRQELVNSERGGFLYARNCRACHGLTGQGALERAGLPGAVLNDPGNRPPTLTAAQVAAKALRFTDTIHCGRVGTLMPPWSTSEGGALNDFQIEQLVMLITSNFSEEAWEHAVEQGNHADLFTPRKHLAAAIGAGDDTITVDSTEGLAADALIRIGADTIDEPYEVLQIVSFDEASGEVEVKRGPDVLGTQAMEHEAGAEVYQGPLPPPTEPITGQEGTVPPCGQKNVAPTPEPGAAEPIALADGDTIEMGDNFFRADDTQNPTFTVTAGGTITVNLSNKGTALHNMRFAGPDGKLDTDDDVVSEPDLLDPGGAGTIQIAPPAAGDYPYRCDVHPVDMNGTITAQ